jgi:uncharacterized MAPEG superfamily protein
MRKLAIFALLVSVLLACEAPAYAKHHHGNKHVNKEARQAQKRNKAYAKQMKKEARARQKSRNNTPYQ